MSAGAGGASVGVDGEDVAGAAEGANGHPATVLAKTHVLDLRRDVKGWKSQKSESRKLHQIKGTSSQMYDQHSSHSHPKSFLTGFYI